MRQNKLSGATVTLRRAMAPRKMLLPRPTTAMQSQAQAAMLGATATEMGMALPMVTETPPQTALQWGTEMGTGTPVATAGPEAESSASTQSLSDVRTLPDGDV
jgi:hypothetical protein